MIPSYDSNKTIIVVTGTSRGIGLGIIERLCESENVANQIIIATARCGKKTTEMDQLLENHPLARDSFIFYGDLDISSEESVKKFGSWMKAQFKHLDVLINNAGYSHCETGDEPDILDIAKKTLQINLYGAMRMVDNLMELLREGSHIINVSSRYGIIKFTDSARRQQFLEYEKMTPELFERLIDDFYKSSGNHTWEKDNWINGAALDNVYSVSKALLNLYTRMLDKKLKEEKVNIKVNCCHPGHCKTDMGGTNAPLTYRDGAETPLWLASFPKEYNPAMTGNFYMDKKSVSFSN